MFFTFRQSVLGLAILIIIFGTGAISPARATPSALTPIPTKKTEAKIELHSPTTIGPGDPFSFTVLYKEKGTSFFVAKNLSAGKAEVRLWFIDPLFQTAVDKGVLTPVDTAGNYTLPTATWLSGTYSIRVNVKELVGYRKQQFVQKAQTAFLLKPNTAGGSYIPGPNENNGTSKPATVILKKISKVPTAPATYAQVTTNGKLTIVNPGAIKTARQLRLRLDLFHDTTLLNGLRAGKMSSEFAKKYAVAVKIAPVVDTTPPPVTVSEDPTYDVKPAPTKTTFTPEFTVDKGVLVIDLMKAMNGKPLPGESVPYVVYVEYSTGLNRVNEVPVMGATNLRLFNSPISNSEASEVYDKESATLPPPPGEITAAEDPTSGNPVTTTPPNSTGKVSSPGVTPSTDSTSTTPKKPAEDQPDKYASLPQGTQTKSSSEPTKPVNDSPDEPTASEEPSGHATRQTTTTTPKTAPTSRSTTR